MKFFSFLKCLFRKRNNVLDATDGVFNKNDIRQMNFISSTKKGDTETIIHGNAECEIEIKIKRNIETGDGTAAIKVIKGNLRLSTNDSIWLLEKYL